MISGNSFTSPAASCSLQLLECQAGALGERRLTLFPLAMKGNLPSLESIVNHLQRGHRPVGTSSRPSTSTGVEGRRFNHRRPR
jgi:hypothetical protein